VCSRITLTLILLTWRIWWAPNNASKWQIGINSAFKGLIWMLILWKSWHFCSQGTWLQVWEVLQKGLQDVSTLITVVNYDLLSLFQQIVQLWRVLMCLAVLQHPLKNWRIIYIYHIKGPWLPRTSSWRKYPNWILLWLFLQPKYISSNNTLPVRILALFDNTEYLTVYHLSGHVGAWLK